MPWLMGVDEAGYGPNLGPFVMTAVACRVPAAVAAPQLWRALSAGVRQAGHPADERLLIDDSKRVYATAAGLGALEAGALAVHAPAEGLVLDGLLAAVCPACRPVLAGECWYTGQTALPVAMEREALQEATARFQGHCLQAGIHWAPLRCVVMLPGQFNNVVDQYGSKGAVLGQALAELLRVSPDDDEPLEVMIDKHGGRHRYAAMLQEAIVDGMVVAVAEGMDRSRYRVLGGRRAMTVTFEPRADAVHLCVALASMVSKYLRELLMREFNQFWQAQVPGLAPTAGYPGDARRFFQAIGPALKKLGIPARQMWRSR